MATVNTSGDAVVRPVIIHQFDDVRTLDGLPICGLQWRLGHLKLQEQYGMADSLGNEDLAKMRLSTYIAISHKPMKPIPSSGRLAASTQKQGLGILEGGANAQSTFILETLGRAGEVGDLSGNESKYAGGLQFATVQPKAAYLTYFNNGRFKVPAARRWRQVPI